MNLNPKSPCSFKITTFEPALNTSQRLTVVPKVVGTHHETAERYAEVFSSTTDMWSIPVALAVQWHLCFLMLRVAWSAAVQ